MKLFLIDFFVDSSEHIQSSIDDDANHIVHVDIPKKLTEENISGKISNVMENLFENKIWPKHEVENGIEEVEKRKWQKCPRNDRYICVAISREKHIDRLIRFPLSRFKWKNKKKNIGH